MEASASATQTQCGSLREWLDEHRVPYTLISLIPRADGKKTPRGVPNGWPAWSYDVCMEYNKGADHKCNALNVNLRAGGLVVIDVDDGALVDAAYGKYGDCHQTASSGRKLPHLWRKRDPEDTVAKTVPKLGGKDIDILYDNVFELVDARFDFASDHVTPLEPYEFFVRAEAPVELDTDCPISADDLSMLRLIDLKYVEDRTSWRAIVSGIHSKYPEADAVAHSFSDRTTNYDPTAVQNLLDTPLTKYTWGSVRHYAKLSDPVNYKKLCATIAAKAAAEVDKAVAELDTAGDLSSWNDFAMAKRYVAFTDGGILRRHGKLVVYNRHTGFWEHDGTRLVSKGIMNDLPTVLEGERTRILAQDVDESAFEARDKLVGKIDKFKRQCGQTTKWAAVTKCVSANIDESDIEFDVHSPYLFAFKDSVVWDMRTGNTVPLDKEHYMTLHTGYDYAAVEDSQVDTLTRWVQQILPEEEERQAMLTVLATGLTGVMLNRFIMLSGEGGNGKGALLSLYMAMLGNYGVGGSIGTLMKPLPDGGAPEVAGLNLRRVARYTEPPDGMKLELSTIKTLTGEPSFSGRALFSNNTKVINHATTIFECNERPSINGRIDAAAARRFVDIRFPVRYTARVDDPDLLAGKPNVYLADRKYESDEWKEENKHVLFELLRRFILETPCAPEGIEVAPKLLAYTQRYLDDSNTGPEWFREHYVQDENALPLKAKEVYAVFKDSDDYTNLTRDEKEGWRVRTFVDRLRTALGKDYKLTHYENGTNWGRSVIVGWRPRVDGE